MRRVELFELIRRDYALGASKRGLARKYGVHRRAVRQALDCSVPPERKPPVRVAPKLTDEAKGFIDQILRADREAPRKQRHTAHRIFQRVREETRAVVAESTVRRYVSARRRELGVGTRVFVPQHHEMGAQGEVDFYEADFEFPWGCQSAQIIVLRSEFSAAALHVAYPIQTQAAFLEGIEAGLKFMGGVFGALRFDNLVLAVSKVLRGCRRTEQDRFIAFRSHYLFKASFTTPGIEGAHEKGGVEGEAGRFRRRWLTPVPRFGSWAEANDYLRACCIADLERALPGAGMTVGEAMALEASLLRPLPAEGFELASLSQPRVDSHARVRVATNFYSVPVSLVGRTVSARLGPSVLEISYEGKVVATHERLHLRHRQSLVLDHYLDLLVERPGAFSGSLPLHQARQRGEFPPSYDELWEKLRARLGERAGTHAMVEILLLHRSFPRAVMAGAIGQAIRLGAINRASVELLARRAGAKQAGQAPI